MKQGEEKHENILKSGEEEGTEHAAIKGCCEDFYASPGTDRIKSIKHGQLPQSSFFPLGAEVLLFSADCYKITIFKTAFHTRQLHKQCLFIFSCINYKKKKKKTPKPPVFLMPLFLLCHLCACLQCKAPGWPPWPCCRRWSPCSQGASPQCQTLQCVQHPAPRSCKRQLFTVTSYNI